MADVLPFPDSPHRPATISRQSHTMTAGFSRYFLYLLASGLNWLLTDSLHLQLSVLDWLPSRSRFPLYGLGPHIKHYFQQFLHRCMRMLLRNGSGIVACLHRCCLAMAVSCWLPYSRRYASCHDIKRLIKQIP